LPKTHCRRFSLIAAQARRWAAESERVSVEEDRVFGKAAALAEQLKTELGLPGWAACLSPAQHYDLALAHAQKLLETRREADPHGMRARQMEGAVMEARADMERLHATHSLGNFGRRSLPNTTSAEIAEREFGRYVESQAAVGAGPYGPSIDDLLRVLHEEPAPRSRARTPAPPPSSPTRARAAVLAQTPF
jgi:hypothetical protein